MSILEQIAKRGITEIVHFTTNRGLTGCLASRELLSRPLLRAEYYLKHVLQMNSASRPEEAINFDKSEEWIRFVNLSVSEINTSFFSASEKWHTHEDLWWTIMSFDPIFIDHDGVWFTTTNNGYDACIRGQGAPGFCSMFDSKIQRKHYGPYGAWEVTRGLRDDRLTTCQQAEVLYPERLSLDYLRRIYTRTVEQHDIVAGLLRDFGFEDVDVVIDTNKFRGMPN